MVAENSTRLPHSDHHHNSYGKRERVNVYVSVVEREMEQTPSQLCYVT